jgi:hypothetical protein
VGDRHVDVGVQVLQLGEGSLSAGDLPDVFFPAVEVAAEVLHGDSGGVVDGDLLGTGEDEVLGDLDSELRMGRDIRH